MTRSLIIAVVAALASGCVNEAVLARAPGVVDGGGSDGLVEPSDAETDGGDDDDAGEADGLEIRGEVYAGSKVENARLATDFETRFSIRLGRGDSAVRGATVTVTSAGGVVTLSDGDGVYVGSQAGYHPAYSLEVVAGTQRVAVVGIAGPDFHSFASPTAGQSHPARSDLAVAWSPAGAATATIETSEMAAVPMADLGSFTVPGSELSGESGQLREDYVRVRRSLHASVPGATAGSSIRFEVRNDVSFLVDAR